MSSIIGSLVIKTAQPQVTGKLCETYIIMTYRIPHEIYTRIALYYVLLPFITGPHYQQPSALFHWHWDKLHANNTPSTSDTTVGCMDEWITFLGQILIDTLGSESLAMWDAYCLNKNSLTTSKYIVMNNLKWFNQSVSIKLIPVVDPSVVCYQKFR